MSKTYKVAVVGCNTLVGEAILTLLEEREFPLEAIYVVAEEGGGRVTFRDRHLVIESLETFDFSQVGLAFFCIDEALAEIYVPAAAKLGCIVIDDSPCFRLEDGIPLVVAGVNPEAIAGYAEQNIIANPGTNATLLTTVLKPLRQASEIARVNVVTLQAVSGKDKAGVEELASQATAMFNLKPIESKIFEKQIAFNVLPQIGAILDDGYSREETKLAWESAEILDQKGLSVNATCLRVPVFHGHALVVNIETEQSINEEMARSLLEQMPDIKLMVDDIPTSVTEAAGEDIVFVGRLRQNPSHARGLDLWLVADNVRMGAALNSVKIAEILIKHYLD